jgi:wobble nucleotide-excising tRNase
MTSSNTWATANCAWRSRRLGTRRNGIPAQALSEGETTAIALLYFLKSLKDRRFDLAKGVVVLDDPVSSLDANALYLAYGFIRERTKDAAQLFILTHNFTFFRQVRNWFHHLKGKDKKQARFYMLDCASDGGQRCSTIRPLDPLLEQYESEYHYLFARIYRGAAAPTPPMLEDNYILPNMARRLLEAFLAFRQPRASGELWQQLKDAKFDEAKKLRILRFLHTHSHGDAIGEPEHDPSLLSEAGSVLKDLVEFIKAQDPEHFAAMVELVEPPIEEGGDV